MVSAVFSIFWDQLKGLKPSFFSKKPHFNFITVHYFWVVGMSFLLSILLYATADGEMAYIDALFFGAGANTQAGLNPIDVNLLNTFQQVCIMIFSMLSNPMAINSYVVFLRLYWFEKKFQDLVRTARSRRGTITKTKSKARTDAEARDPEKGVNGRDIRVMHGGAPQRIANDGFILGEPNGKEANSSSDGEGVSPRGTPPPPDEQNHDEQRGPGITFAGVVKRSDGMNDTALRLAPRSDEEHIAILQRQRNNENDDVLRIPGPRDVELGERPRKVEGGRSDEPEPLSPRRPTRRRDSDAEPAAADRPKITIQEPDRSTHKPSRKEELGNDARAFINVFSPFRNRRPRALNGDDPIHHITHGVTRRNTIGSVRGAMSRDREDDQAPYLSFQPTLGRNSQFVGELTDEEREELGGIEYRSLKTLSLVLTCYFWGYWILGLICLVPWIYNTSYGSIVDNAGQNRGWWGVFTSSSAFTDLGFTLTADSMNSFNTAVFPLLIMSFFIVIGNTGFPVMLRFVIWCTSRLVPRGSGLWEELRFLLDHPRRCFTLLFPAAATWWLFWLLVGLNGLDLIFFIVLDLGSGVVADLSAGLKILQGVFQAFSTRTAGFSCVNLSLLHPGVQTSYMIMMYISIFPIAISVRRTNVYEEKSLGIYHGAEDNQVAGDEGESAGSLSYVGAHLRRQLSFDLWYIFIGFFILSISEGGRIQNNDFTMFAVLFEVVSAYGTVGLSLGFTGVNASLSSQFTIVGKLVIIAMQIRGRHRGLPYGLDRAVLLPSESRFRRDAEVGDGGHGGGGGGLPRARTLTRRNSVASVATGASGFTSHYSRVNRVNSNVIARMLHPGPAVPPPLKRSKSDAVADDGGEEPGFATYRSIPPRSETFSMGRRSVPDRGQSRDES